MPGSSVSSLSSIGMDSGDERSGFINDIPGGSPPKRNAQRTVETHNTTDNGRGGGKGHHTGTHHGSIADSFTGDKKEDDASHTDKPTDPAANPSEDPHNPAPPPMMGRGPLARLRRRLQAMHDGSLLHRLRSESRAVRATLRQTRHVARSLTSELRRAEARDLQALRGSSSSAPAIKDSPAAGSANANATAVAGGVGAGVGAGLGPAMKESSFGASVSAPSEAAEQQRAMQRLEAVRRKVEKETEALAVARLRRQALEEDAEAAERAAAQKSDTDAVSSPGGRGGASSPDRRAASSSKRGRRGDMSPESRRRRVSELESKIESVRAELEAATAARDAARASDERRIARMERRAARAERSAAEIREHVAALAKEVAYGDRAIRRLVAKHGTVPSMEHFDDTVGNDDDDGDDDGDDDVEGGPGDVDIRDRYRGSDDDSSNGEDRGRRYRRPRSPGLKKRIPGLDDGSEDDEDTPPSSGTDDGKNKGKGGNATGPRIRINGVAKNRWDSQHVSDVSLGSDPLDRTLGEQFLDGLTDDSNEDGADGADGSPARVRAPPLPEYRNLPPRPTGAHAGDAAAHIGAFFIDEHADGDDRHGLHNERHRQRDGRKNSRKTNQGDAKSNNSGAQAKGGRKKKGPAYEVPWDPAPEVVEGFAGFEVIDIFAEPGSGTGNDPNAATGGGIDGEVRFAADDVLGAIEDGPLGINAVTRPRGRGRRRRSGSSSAPSIKYPSDTTASSDDGITRGDHATDNADDDKSGGGGGGGIRFEIVGASRGPSGASVNNTAGGQVLIGELRSIIGASGSLAPVDAPPSRQVSRMTAHSSSSAFDRAHPPSEVGDARAATPDTSPVGTRGGMPLHHASPEMPARVATVSQPDTNNNATTNNTISTDTHISPNINVNSTINTSTENGNGNGNDNENDTAVSSQLTPAQARKHAHHSHLSGLSVATGAATSTFSGSAGGAGERSNGGLGIGGVGGVGGVHGMLRNTGAVSGATGARRNSTSLRRYPFAIGAGQSDARSTASGGGGGGGGGGGLRKTVSKGHHPGPSAAAVRTQSYANTATGSLVNGVAGSVAGDMGTGGALPPVSEITEVRRTVLRPEGGSSDEDVVDNNAAGSATSGDGNRGHQPRLSYDGPGDLKVVQLNQYTILRTVGEGSVGKVKLAVDAATGRTYAIKMIKRTLLERKRIRKRPVKGRGRGGTADTGGGDGSAASPLAASMKRRVYREIETMKRLSHPNVVNLHEVIDDAKHSKLYLVLDFVPGGCVLEASDWSRHRRIPEDVARGYARDIVNGLDYLHAMGVVHEDLKPENLLLTQDHVVKIADFGMAHVLEGIGDGTVADLASLGTPAYAAPERLQGGRIAGPESDIWSFGVCIYQFLFGNLPYEANNTADMLDMIAAGPPPLPEDTGVSEAARDLVRSMLQLEPEKRIAIADIRNHPWITCDGEVPLVQIETDPRPMKGFVSPSLVAQRDDFVHRVIGEIGAGQSVAGGSTHRPNPFSIAVLPPASAADQMSPIPRSRGTQSRTASPRFTSANNASDIDVGNSSNTITNNHDTGFIDGDDPNNDDAGSINGNNISNFGNQGGLVVTPEISGKKLLPLSPLAVLTEEDLTRFVTHLPTGSWDASVASLPQRDVPPGTVLATTGAPLRSLFLVASGNLSAESATTGAHLRCGPCSVVGDVDALVGQDLLPWEINVRATTQSRIVHLGSEVVEEIRERLRSREKEGSSD